MDYFQHLLFSRIIALLFMELSAWWDFPFSIPTQTRSDFYFAQRIGAGPAKPLLGFEGRCLPWKRSFRRLKFVPNVKLGFLKRLTRNNDVRSASSHSPSNQNRP